MKRILVIDDDPGVRKVLAKTLTRQGYAVTAVPDGRTAVRQTRTASVDLVITDILMPEMDGIETIKALKAQHPVLKIMAITGGGHYLNRELCFHLALCLGAEVVLEKPLEAKPFLETVAALLGGGEAPAGRHDGGAGCHPDANV